MSEILRLAALNNAEWCETVCRAHGRPGHFSDALWINRHAAPSFYPNVVTLHPDRQDEQFAAIAELAKSMARFAVKDSYSRLQLTQFGFSPLLSADWIIRETTNLPMPRKHPNNLQWGIVQSLEELQSWEAAWSGGAVARNVFPPALLDSGAVTLIAGWRDGRIIAGAALNRSERVVGWSNVFVPPEEDKMACRAAALAVAVEIANGLSMVGYERGDDLAASLDLGFSRSEC